MTITRRAFNAAVVGGAAFVALDGCGAKKQPPTNKAAADEVTFLTGFGTAPRECYAYVGDGLGFFAEAGIHLTIAPGQPSDTNLKTLASGKAWFAAIDFVSAVRGMSTPAYSYAAIMAIQGQTLLSMITLPGRGISGPKDLAGRTLGTAPAAATQTLFPAYANLAGIDTTAHPVKFANFPSDQLPTNLAAHNIDAMGAYQIDTPGIQAAAKGTLPIVFPYGNVMTDLYGTVIVVRKDILANKPDLVKRFASAMWKGVKAAVADPPTAGTLVHKAVRTVSADIMTTTMGLMKPFVTSPGFELPRVAKAIALLQTAGLADAGLVTSPERVVDTRFAPPEA
jgi:NitT/TauT family transport system substrate-binding protein